MSTSAKPRQIKPHQAEISLQVEYLKVLVGRPPISFYEPFGRIAGSASGGLFLSQLLYWSCRGANQDGWIYKPQHEWTRETCLKRGEQESARRVLVKKEILEEERRGTPCQLYYRLSFPKLHEAIRALCHCEEKEASAGLPSSKDGWLAILQELVEAGIWEYKTYSKKRIASIPRLTLRISARIARTIEEKGQPDPADIEALTLHREFRARQRKKLELERAEAEARKKDAEHQPDIAKALAGIAAAKRELKGN